MTSSEKILAGIIDEAKQNAEQIIAKANEKATADVKDAVANVDAECEAIIADAEKKAAVLNSTGISSAALIKRDRMLSFRRQAINNVLNKVEEKISSMNDEDYFSFIADMITKNALSVDGEILLSKNDMARNTDILISKLSNPKLKLNKTPADITDGFMLKYGDIQINGEIKALIHEKRELLVDNINHTLFG